LAAILAALFAAVTVIQGRIDDRFGEYRATEEILYVDNGEALKKALLGFESIASDLYWLRTVQYFGGQRLESTEKRFELLQPLLDITTTLDPHLSIAYTYGATFLAEEWPRGAGEPLKALELIDKGIRNNPDQWRLYLDKGFIYFWYLEDYAKAADIFLAGSKLPDAPYWMVATAGRTLTQGGDRETARHLWKVFYDTAENDQMRYNALVHLQQLDAMDQTDLLTKVALQFKQERGHFPGGWQEMIAAGYMRGVPADPVGVPYELNPKAERVEVSRRSSLAALPTRSIHN
jgi:tetratricopeptide (TPR) repeat protein